MATEASSSQPFSVFWLRRDLRLQDNAALYHALRSGLPVQPVFILDANILSELPAEDRRVAFIVNALQKLQDELATYGAALWIEHGKPLDVWSQLVAQWPVRAVYANEDYEPYAKQRDAAIHQFLQARGVAFNTYKDHVLLAGREVVKADGQPYPVFPP